MPLRTFLLLLAGLLAIGLLGPGALAGDAPDPAAVHRAIERGAGWLRREFASGFRDRTWHDPVELVVLTLHHAGANRSDEVFTKGLEITATAPLRFTYRTAVTAMALGEVNPRLYRTRLAHCAQWLVDTQLEGGEWGYPGILQGPSHQPGSVTVDPPTEESAEGGSAAARIVIERRVEAETYGGAKGDFSNTQFALLGLRACRDAGIEVPKATWQTALDYMARYQRKDGGWGYVYGGEQDEASYASLTCAGVCGAALCLHALGKRPRSHRTVTKGLAWLDKRFDARRNVGIDRSAILGPSSWQLYHLYSVERVGRVLRIDEIGGKPWYPAGARHLLETQRGDGSWADPGGGVMGERARYLEVADTCFAILFLARATPPLTGGR